MNAFSLTGNPDLKSFKGTTMANKCMVYMVAGVKNRWKFTLGSDLTSDSFSSTAACERITEMVQRMYQQGITIKALVTDMGGTNLAF